MQYLENLSLVFPHRIMVDIEEMILALDKVTPGIASDETYYMVLK